PMWNACSHQTLSRWVLASRTSWARSGYSTTVRPAALRRSAPSQSTNRSGSRQAKTTRGIGQVSTSSLQECGREVRELQGSNDEYRVAPVKRRSAGSSPRNATSSAWSPGSSRREWPAPRTVPSAAADTDPTENAVDEGGQRYESSIARRSQWMSASPSAGGGPCSILMPEPSCSSAGPRRLRACGSRPDAWGTWG